MEGYKGGFKGKHFILTTITITKRVSKKWPTYQAQIILLNIVLNIPQQIILFTNKKLF